MKGETFGFFQRNFRYRLVETNGKTLLWERWQSTDEGSPAWVFVSEDVCVVIRAHGLNWGSDQLLFINPQGKKQLVVVVAAEGYVDALPRGAKPKKRRRRNKVEHSTTVWKDEHVRTTTAGPMWTAGSFETFPTSRDARYFCLRTGWGRRLIVDLVSMTLVEESALADDARALVQVEERRQALDALGSLAPIVESGDADYSQRHRVEGALAVVMAQGISEAAPPIRQLERTPSAGSWRLCSVLGGGWHAGHNGMRSLARLALRLIGEEPAPGGNYAFSNRFPGAPRDEAETVTPLSVATPSRAWELAKATPPGSSAQWVLTNLGAPDFIRRESRKVDKYNVWSEVWDYDGPEKTTRIFWSFPETSRREVADRPRQVLRVEELEAWKERDRLLAVLGFME